MTTEGPTRREMFALFDEKNLSTPEHGIVSEVVPTLQATYWMTPDLSTSNLVVVYTDESKHRGEGKVVLNFSDALSMYPDFYCSEFIPTVSYSRDLGSPVSWRILQVGNRAWKLRYKNNVIPRVIQRYDGIPVLDSWQSNVGSDIEVFFMGEVGKNQDFDYPLFAIDYVAHPVYPGATLCIDLNIAPQIKGTGLEYKLDPDQIVELITDNFNKIETPRRYAVPKRPESHNYRQGDSCVVYSDSKQPVSVQNLHKKLG